MRSDKLMWRWDPDTFGSVAPNTNPAGLGTFTYNLRFPGQYSLNESGLYYNYYRDLDPQTGRYIESDPIGLVGGINTYLYVHAAPVSRVDRRGTGPTVRGSVVDKIIQNVPDWCGIWPKACIDKIILCTRAKCTYIDCHSGKPFVIDDLTFYPTLPNGEELAKKSPNCQCTHWKAFDNE
jgi:RHS repeat-associated protein